MLFLNASNKFSPIRKKHLCANQSRFVNKELSESLMHRRKLHHELPKQKATQARMVYNKQRNIYATILRKSKRAYFGNLDIKNFI